MAQKPTNNTLPADLPVNWVNTQTITAGGAEAGLTTKHGYNYLNEQINETQESVNLINEAFEDLATVNYVDNEIGAITGTDEGFLQHKNNGVVHASVAEKAKWNKDPVVSHWSLGEDADIDTTNTTGMMLDYNKALTWTNVNAANVPPSFSVPFEADIVAIVNLDCQAYGTATGNSENGIGVRLTFNRGFGNAIVKNRAIKATGIDYLSAPSCKQQIRGTISVTETFKNQPANTPISLNIAHRRIASDWGESTHIGGRSVTYIACPV